MSHEFNACNFWGSLKWCFLHESWPSWLQGWLPDRLCFPLMGVLTLLLFHFPMNFPMFHFSHLILMRYMPECCRIPSPSVQNAWSLFKIVSVAIKSNIYKFSKDTNSMYTLFSSTTKISASISLLIYAVFMVFGASFAASLLNRNQGFGVARCVSAALQVPWVIGGSVWSLEMRSSWLDGNPGFNGK